MQVAPPDDKILNRSKLRHLVEGQIKHFFCKKCISYTNSPWKSKKQDKKRAKNHKKRCFYWHFCPHSANGAHRLRNEGRGANKNTLFLRVFASFMCSFLFFHGQFVYEMLFLQKKSFHLTFSSHRSAIYKVPPRIGGHHFLLCQQTNTKDIAGQSAREEEVGCWWRKQGLRGFSVWFLTNSSPIY